MLPNKKAHRIPVGFFVGFWQRSTGHILVVLVLISGRSLGINKGEGCNKSDNYSDNDYKEVCAIANYLVEKHRVRFNAINVGVPAYSRNTAAVFLGTGAG
jgi:hypothetical protein